MATTTTTTFCSLLLLLLLAVFFSNQNVSAADVDEENSVELFYCADESPDGGFDYRFRLDKVVAGHDNSHLRLIMFGIREGVFTNQSPPPEAQVLENFVLTSQAPAPFDDIQLDGNHYMLTPILKKWEPQTVGESLQWKGHADNYIPKGGLWWTFTSTSDLPNKETYILAQECPPAKDGDSVAATHTPAPTPRLVTPAPTPGPTPRITPRPTTSFPTESPVQYVPPPDDAGAKGGGPDPDDVPANDTQNGKLDCSSNAVCNEGSAPPNKYNVCIEEDGVHYTRCRDNFFVPPVDLVDMTVKHCGSCRLGG